MTITQSEIKRLIALLDARALNADDALYDEMERVRRDLSRLDGDVERLPHEASLRAWGLLDETAQESSPHPVAESGQTEVQKTPSPDGEHQAPPLERMEDLPKEEAIPAASPYRLSRDEIKDLRSRLNRRLGQTGNLGNEEADRRRAIQVEVRQWMDSEMLTPLPYAADLETLGVWPPEEQIAVRELHKAHEMMEAGKHEDVLPFLNDLLARLQEDEPRRQVEKTRDEFELGLVKQEIAQARSLANQHLYDRALQNLGGLTARFRSDAAMSEIKIAQDDVAKERKSEISAREKRALQLEVEKPEDFPAHEQAWKAVQDLDGENPRAEKALLELGKKKSQADLVHELRELAGDLENAIQKKDLKKLNELRGHYERVTLLLQGTPYAREAALAHEAFIEKQNQLRDELGIVATRQAQGELGLAYRHIREQYEKGIASIEIYEYVTTSDGKKAPAQKPTLMATSAALEYIAREYVDFLKTKIHENIDRLKDYTNEPKVILQKVAPIRREFLDEAGLTSAHRMMLTAEERELQRIEADATESAAKYDQAFELFFQAQDNAKSLVEKYKLLLQAKQLFPALGGLQDEIRKNEQQQIDRKVNQVRAELARAWNLALDKNYAEARKALDAQRNQVEEIGGEVFKEYLEYGEKIILRQQEEERQSREKRESEERLAKEEKDKIEKQKELEKKIKDELEARKAQILELLAEYDRSQNDLNLLRFIGELIQDMETQYPAKRVETILLRREVSSRQGPAELLHSGENAYLARKWVEAAETFARIKDPKYAELVSQRINRAQAASEAETAAAAFKAHDYIQARHLALSARKMFFGGDEDGVGVDDVTRTIANQLPGLIETIEFEQKRAADEAERQQKIESEKQEREQKRAQREEEERLAKEKHEVEAQGILEEIAYFRTQVLKAKSSKMMYDLVNNELGFEKLIEKAKIGRDNNALPNYRIQLHEAGEDVRNLWREFNREMMLVVVNTNDLATLKTACDKAKAVKDIGLFEPEDDGLFAELQAKALDVEYEHWFPVKQDRTLPKGVSSWLEIENNRRERLRVEKYRPVNPVVSQKTGEVLKALETKVREIADRRILTDIEQKQAEILTSVDSDNDASLRQAYSALVDYMQDLPDVSNSALLLEEAIKKAWNAARWFDAAKLAQRFSHFGESDISTNRQVFEILTNVARAYAENKPEDGKAFLPKELRPSVKDEPPAKKPESQTMIDGNTQPTSLLSGSTLSSDNIKKISEIERELRAESIRRLLKRAQDYASKGTENDYIQASHLYALAYRYDGANESVRTGLEQVWTHIGGAIEKLCQQANTLTIHGNTLADLNKACEEAENLLPDLNGFMDLANTVVISVDSRKRLSDASRNLADKVRTWRSFYTELEDYEKQLKWALSHPHIVGLDAKDLANSKFGWDVVYLKSRMNKLQSIISDMTGDDSEAIRGLFDVKRKERDDLEARLRGLNKAVREFRIALEEEDFERLPEKARTLETVWNLEAKRDIRFAGLDTLISYQHHEPYSEEDTLARHLEIVVSQKKNWEEWHNWCQDVVARYMEISQKESALRLDSGRFLHSSDTVRQMEMEKHLATLKEENSLVSIIESCERLKERCTVLMEILSSQPQNERESYRADKEFEQIQPPVEQMQQRIETLQGLLGILHEIAGIQKEKLAAPLADLKSFLEKTVRPNANTNKSGPKEYVKRTAENFIAPCAQIDPLDPEVIALRKEIRKLLA